MMATGDSLLVKPQQWHQQQPQPDPYLASQGPAQQGLLLPPPLASSASAETDTAWNPAGGSGTQDDWGLRSSFPLQLPPPPQSLLQSAPPAADCSAWGPVTGARVSRSRAQEDACRAGGLSPAPGVADLSGGAAAYPVRLWLERLPRTDAAVCHGGGGGGGGALAELAALAAHSPAAARAELVQVCGGEDG